MRSQLHLSSICDLNRTQALYAISIAPKPNTSARAAGPSGYVLIPNSGKAEVRFEMFNKQPAGYLYHVLPMFGATETFTKSLLRWLMDAGLATEAPKCVYDAVTQILTTPPDAQQESVLSDVCSLPFI